MTTKNKDSANQQLLIENLEHACRTPLGTLKNILALARHQPLSDTDLALANRQIDKIVEILAGLRHADKRD